MRPRRPNVWNQRSEAFRAVLLLEHVVCDFLSGLVSTAAFGSFVSLVVLGLMSIEDAVTMLSQG